MRIIITIVTLEYQRERDRDIIFLGNVSSLHWIVVEMSDSESFSFAKCYCKINIQL